MTSVLALRFVTKYVVKGLVGSADAIHIKYKGYNTEYLITHSLSMFYCTAIIRRTPPSHNASTIKKIKTKSKM